MPYSFDSAVTVTSTPGDAGDRRASSWCGTPPRRRRRWWRCANNLQFITTIAAVTFYGKDHAGNDVQAVGQIGVTFGNFGDPD